MNDKCAAGTGRFLDVMANILQIRIDDLGPCAMQAERAAVISSTCTVFARIRGHLAAGRCAVRAEGSRLNQVNRGRPATQASPDRKALHDGCMLTPAESVCTPAGKLLTCRQEDR